MPWAAARESFLRVLSLIALNIPTVYTPSAPFNMLAAYSDASSTGWAFLVEGAPFSSQVVRHGPFQWSAHINVKETFAVYKLLEFLCPRLPGSHFRLFCDNMATVSQVNRKRGASFLSNLWVSKIIQLLKDYRCEVTLSWVSTLDMRADPWTRLSYD